MTIDLRVIVVGECYGVLGGQSRNRSWPDLAGPDRPSRIKGVLGPLARNGAEQYCISGDPLSMTF